MGRRCRPLRRPQPRRGRYFFLFELGIDARDALAAQRQVAELRHILPQLRLGAAAELRPALGSCADHPVDMCADDGQVLLRLRNRHLGGEILCILRTTRETF